MNILISKFDFWNLSIENFSFVYSILKEYIGPNHCIY